MATIKSFNELAKLPKEEIEKRGEQQKIPNVSVVHKELNEYLKQGEQKQVIDIAYKFSTEFEKQVSHIIASILNGEHEYNEGTVKYMAQTLLGHAKNEQKPAWSEEDEQIALSIEQVMSCASLLNIVPEKVDKIRTWLKSLKERTCNVI